MPRFEHCHGQVGGKASGRLTVPEFTTANVKYSEVLQPSCNSLGTHLNVDRASTCSKVRATRQKCGQCEAYGC